MCEEEWMDKNGVNDYSVRDAESSASKALERVRKDPDNSGRANRTGEAAASSSRLARQGQSQNRQSGTARQNQTGERRSSTSDKTRRSGTGGSTAKTGATNGVTRTGSSGTGRTASSRTGSSRTGTTRTGTARTGTSGSQGTRRSPQGQDGSGTRAARQGSSPASDGARYVRQSYDDDFEEVRINRNKRTWNKYKNYIFAGVGIIVALIILVTGVKSCARKQKEEEASLYSQPSMGALQVSSAADEGTSQSEEQSSASQAAASQGVVLTTTKTAAEEDYTSQDFYGQSVFIGDSIVSGISYYKYLDSARTVYDNNLTASKAVDKVSEVVSKSPQRVYIMLGINDLNYNTKTPDSIAEDFATLISKIKQELPSTTVYVISVTPVTSAFESKSSTYVKMSNVEELNNKLKEAANSTGGYYFVDINSSLQDSSGYMNSDLTGNGYGLKVTYYPFLLNTIAEMTK
jgi:hypothetical protein